MRIQWLFPTALFVCLTACSISLDITGSHRSRAEGNLIPDPLFREAVEGKTGIWRHDEGGGFSIVPSKALPYREGHTPKDPERFAITVDGITGLRQSWEVPLPPCRPGEAYHFTAEVHRSSWQNGVYPEVSIWGELHRLDTTLQTGVFQPVSVHLRCPPAKGRENRFRFVNPHGNTFFAMRSPRLLREAPLPEIVDPHEGKPVPMASGLFPIGVYGAKMEDLFDVQALGVNAVVIGGSDYERIAAIRECNRLDLFYLVATPREPDRLPAFLETVSLHAEIDRLGFYVNDEPGIHAFPAARADAIRKTIAERFPSAPTAMAVVRPQIARNYREGADFFMVDPYPIPFMPVTWLSDSMDRVARDLGAHRLASVVQAFGGEKWVDYGWPRPPTWQEMNCLAFLSVIHDSRGVFFYSWPALKESSDGPDRLERVIQRLLTVYPWLADASGIRRTAVRMTALNQTDYQGRAAVHCSVRCKEGQPLLLCANTIPTYTEAEIFMEATGNSASKWKEMFTGATFHRDRQILRARFDPFQVRAWIPEGEN